MTITVNQLIQVCSALSVHCAYEHCDEYGDNYCLTHTVLSLQILLESMDDEQKEFINKILLASLEE